MAATASRRPREIILAVRVRWQVQVDQNLVKLIRPPQDLQALAEQLRFCSTLFRRIERILRCAELRQRTSQFLTRSRKALELRVHLPRSNRLQLSKHHRSYLRLQYADLLELTVC